MFVFETCLNADGVIACIKSNGFCNVSNTERFNLKLLHMVKVLFEG